MGVERAIDEPDKTDKEDVQRTQAPAWAYYVAAVCLSLCVFAIAVLLPWPVPKLGAGFLFLLTVTVIAYAGGFGPALLAVALGALGDIYFCPPAGSLHALARSDVVLVGGFATVGGLIAVAGACARQAE